VGSIDRRIEALERLYGGPSREEDPPGLARRREEVKSTLGRTYEKAEREEAEGNPQRRIALEALEEQMRKRIRARGL
jgi:hypothetical protein